jgi:hypothetical protein
MKDSRLIRLIGRVPWWLIPFALIQAALIQVLAWILPGVDIDGAGAAIRIAIVVIVVTTVCWPFAYGIAARVHPLFFPVLIFVLSSLIPLVISLLLSRHEFAIDGIWSAIPFIVGLTIGTTVAAAFLSVNDAATYDYLVTHPLRWTNRTPPEVACKPAFLFFAIDGLAEPVLRRAIAEGYLPTLNAGLTTAVIRSPAGSRISRRRPRPARPASSSATTPAFPPSAGTTRRPAA